ncbi:hypothetical protein Tco_0154682 [Tanacetum coccineum]
MVISSPCLTDKKELASPKQTTLGKHISNPLIVDSLLKPIWFINAPCFCNKSLAIPGQTATGISKEVGTPRYLSLVVPLTKVGDEAVHRELGDRMEKGYPLTASSLEAEPGYTAEEFLSTDEEIAQKLNKEEMTKAAASEGLRKYWKIIRVRDVIVAYQSFEDMLKGFDREDLVALWSLVKERFRFADYMDHVQYISRRLQVEDPSIETSTDESRIVKKKSGTKTLIPDGVWFMWCSHGCLIFIIESMDLIRLLEVCSRLYDVYEEASGVIDIDLIFNHGAIDVYCLWI